MKRKLPIIIVLCLTAFTSCIKDDIANCPGKMHFHFSYIYGGVNRFFEMEKTDLGIHFYHAGEATRYRQMTIPRNSIGLTEPLTMDKTPDDLDQLEVISWSTDPAIEYVNAPDTPQGEGYVHLKEITEGSGICRPVDDLFYGRVTFDAEDRFARTDVTIPYVRAVCRMRVTMIPESVQSRGTILEDGTTHEETTRAAIVIPHPEDYTFHVSGTLNTINDNNIVGGEEIILAPECYYDETDGYVKTNWFGAFPGKEEEYLKVNVFIKEKEVAQFDCTPNGIASVAGNYVDLVIDGRYVRPVLEVRVDGWRVAIITSNM